MSLAKKIYLVRHCAAEGQGVEAKLTEEGVRQAEELLQFFQKVKIDRIISSPYRRALESIQPFSEASGIPIEPEDRLAERILSSRNLVDWQSKLKATFNDLNLKFTGGESSREAMERIACVVRETFQFEEETTILVTHGNLLSLFLHLIDKSFGFEEWAQVSNPDIYLITEDMTEFTRVWHR